MILNASVYDSIYVIYNGDFQKSINEPIYI